jgi:hypothetical protein
MAKNTLRTEHVKGIPKVYVVKEPDTGGPVFVAGVTAQLQDIGYTGQAYVIEMPFGLKDLRGLHVKFLGNDPKFKESLQSAIGGAVPLMLDAPKSAPQEGSVVNTNALRALTPHAYAPVPRPAHP